jgi:hypothetical protein
LVTAAVTPDGVLTRPSPVGAVPVPLVLVAVAVAVGEALVVAVADGEAVAVALADAEALALADADADAEALVLVLALAEAEVLLLPPGPVSVMSSARNEPCPYQPWVYTCTEVVLAPVVKEVDSWVQLVALGVQLEAETPVPVAPM